MYCFGKQRHAAALHFGVCMAYGVPLLYKNSDLTKTDMEAARGAAYLDGDRKPAIALPVQPK